MDSMANFFITLSVGANGLLGIFSAILVIYLAIRLLNRMDAKEK